MWMKMVPGRKTNTFCFLKKKFLTVRSWKSLVFLLFEARHHQIPHSSKLGVTSTDHVKFGIHPTLDIVLQQTNSKLLKCRLAHEAHLDICVSMTVPLIIGFPYGQLKAKKLAMPNYISP